MWSFLGIQLLEDMLPSTPPPSPKYQPNQNISPLVMKTLNQLFHFIYNIAHLQLIIFSYHLWPNRPHMTQGPNIGPAMQRIREKKKNRLNGAQSVLIAEPTSPFTVEKKRAFLCQKFYFYICRYLSWFVPTVEQNVCIRHRRIRKSNHINHGYHARLLNSCVNHHTNSLKLAY